ncbi:MAG: glycosyltransferase [Desulfobacteraceae bacterium 4572_187]|nr:MAG: glycosyltransferase [Desulfobacteraceae bacterium 4572_187]
MKIAIATVQVPFITGGAEIHAKLLHSELVKRGHETEIVSIPFKWYPSETLLNCMVMGRMMDLTEVNGEKIDMVIAMKFPAYYVKHPNKVLWLLHQHRQAYDLWGTEYGDMHVWEDGEFIRNTIIANDNRFIREAKQTFTNAQNSADRLKKYNNIDAVPLYHPPVNHEKLRCENFDNYIFYPSRIDKMKRQRLLVEAARFLKTDTKIYLAGKGSENEMAYLNSLISKYSLKDKVKLLGFITEEEKIRYYANCLGVYFGAYDEDYGYITLEAFFSKKPVIVHKDAGGPLEFVDNGKNGLVLGTDPKIIAATIDAYSEKKSLAKHMGAAGYDTVLKKNINWDHIIRSLLKGL